MEIIFEKSMSVESGSVANLFDADPATSVTGTNNITFTIAADQCNAIAFFGLDAFSITLSLVNNGTSEVVYTETISLLTEYSTSWSEFFSQDIYYKTAVKSGTMPFYANSSLTVTIEKTGHTAECVECVIGRKKYIGGMKEGGTFGRDWVKRARVQVQIDRNSIDQIHKALSSIEDIPAVFICQNDIELEAGLIYGTIYDFDIPAISSSKPIINLEVEGIL